jgi:hypothetical protein
MARVLSLFSRPGVMLTTLPLIGRIGFARDVRMKHPVRSEFGTAVTEVSVTVTFRPTNSIYSFYRLADSEDVARLGPVSLERVRHAGSSGDTEDYPSDEVQAMAQRIASEVGSSVWSVQDQKEADKLTLRGHAIGGDDDVIE